MDNKVVRRAYFESDKEDFSEANIPLLKRASEEIKWLLDRGYPISSAVLFVGNHYSFSCRQRIAS